MRDLESSVERALARQTILGPPLTEGPSRCRVRTHRLFANEILDPTTGQLN
jgi:hypothetical protein